MENFVVKIDVEVKASMVLSEIELRALDALVGYGVEPFLKVFYSQMGKHYLQPHEAGLRALFKNIGQTTPGPLRQADNHRHWLHEAAKERPLVRVKAAPVSPAPEGPATRHVSDVGPSLWSRFCDWIWNRDITLATACEDPYSYSFGDSGLLKKVWKVLWSR